MPWQNNPTPTTKGLWGFKTLRKNPKRIVCLNIEPIVLEKTIMPETSGILLDVDYHTNEQNESEIQLFVRTSHGLELFTDPSFKPYFFVICKELQKTREKLEKSVFGENNVSITSIKTQPKTKEKNVLKLGFKNTSELIAVRSELKEWAGVERREYDIPFAKRYLIDTGLQPLSEIKIQFTEQNKRKIIQQAKKTESTEIPKLKLAAFDLETYSPDRFSDPTQDPIL